jgi:NADPH:quinone reductase-like Zn-dependent oxidoreductase
MDFEHAAAIPVVYATAFLLVSDVARIREGDRVLVHMAAGAVGLAVIELCRRMPGVELFGTASASKHEFLKKHGLDYAIDYRSEDFETVVRRLTDGRGVDVVLDPMGGSHWKKNYRLLAPLGRLVLYGFANAAQAGRRSWARVIGQLLQSPRWSPMKLMNDNRAVMGLNLGNLFGESELIRTGLDRLSQLIEEGAIQPTVDAAVPFSRAAEAHQRIEDRKNVGKVVLVPDP